MVAEITFDQPLGAGPGTAGKARNDIWLDQTVNMVSSGTGTTYSWELLNAPPGSAATISNPTLSTATITPDVMGTYRIRLTVDGGGVGNRVTKVIRARYDSSGVIYKRGWALPAVGEEEDEADYGTNDRHWDEAWQGITTDMRGSLTKTLVFQPGGTAEGNTFTDWSLLMTALGETQGDVVIVVDDDYDDAIIPAGTWQLGERASIVGLYSLNYLFIATGGVVRNPKSIWNIRSTANAISQGYFEVDKKCHIYNSVLTNTSALLPTLGLNINAKVWLHDTTISNGVGGASSVVTNYGVVGAGPTLYLEGYSSIEDDTLDGTFDWFIHLNSTSTATTTHTNASGTITIYAPPSGVTTTFVFQPGGTAENNVYTDWSLLMADVVDVSGPRIVEIDPSISGNPVSIPAGTWDFGREVILRGRFADIVLADGAVLQDLLQLDGFLTVYSSSSSPIFTWTAGPKYLVLKDAVTINGGAFGPPPGSPLITSSVTMYLYGHSSLAASLGNAPVLANTSGSSSIRMFDGSIIGAADGGAGDSYALQPSAPGTCDVEIYSPGVYFQHGGVTGLTWTPYCVRQYVVPLTKGMDSNATSTPAAVGGAYVSYQQVPKHQNMKCKFRVILETTSGAVGYEAYMDLFDVHGQLNAGTPSVVTGSQMDTGTASTPDGAPTPNPLIPSLYEVDLTPAIVGGTWVSDIAVFEARLWIGIAAGGNAATCKSAELVFEWTELAPVAGPPV